MNWPKMFNGFCSVVNRHSPEILTGLGVAGFVTAMVLAVKATPKDRELIIHAEDEKEDTLTLKETVKAAWKPYIPAVVTAVASAGCVIGAAKINNKRNAELATAYAISQAMVKRYQEKTAEIAGEEKAKEIDTAVREETAKSPAVQASVNSLPSINKAGLLPFYDPFSNTPFYASPNMLKNAEVEINRRLYTGGEPYATYDDMYDELNEQGVYPPLKHTCMSSDYGWTPDNGGVEFDLDPDGLPFEQGHWDDGTPCYVMSFKRYRSPEYIR